MSAMPSAPDRAVVDERLARPARLIPRVPSLSVVRVADTAAVGLVSPELVLVDPTLREAALAALPSPSDCLTRPRPASVARAENTQAPVDPAPAPAPAPVPTPARIRETTPRRPAVSERPTPVRAHKPSVVAADTRRVGPAILVLVLLCLFLSAYFLGPALLDLL